MIAEYGWRSDYIYFFNDAKIALPALVLVIIWPDVVLILPKLVSPEFLK